MKKRGCALVLALLLVIGSLSGCGRLKYDMPYDADTQISGFNVVEGRKADTSDPFAEALCVVIDDLVNDEDVDMSQADAAVLMDLNDRQVLYAKNAHEQLHPASLTKVMTALVALKHGSLDQNLTATSAVNITESGAQLLGIKSGDTMTLDQALRILLLYSANDVAMLIAENIGGTVEHFVEMMNEEANSLGATNTHFANPHGLTQEEHYTTAYDLYLIFNEAIRYETFNEIIQMSSYQTTYYNGSGSPMTVDINSTNQFHKGTYNGPENVTIIGGKTGTTAAAGHCLILLARDRNGAPYISAILKSQGTETLYKEMADLLDEINK